MWKCQEARSWEIGRLVVGNNDSLHLVGATCRSGTFIPIILFNFLNSMSATVSPILHEVRQPLGRLIQNKSSKMLLLVCTLSNHSKGTLALVEFKMFAPPPANSTLSDTNKKAYEPMIGL